MISILDPTIIQQQFNISTKYTKLGMVDSERNLSAAQSGLETRNKRAFGNKVKVLSLRRDTFVRDQFFIMIVNDHFCDGH